MSQVVPIGDRINRNVLFTCLGSPGKPVVDTVGPLAAAARATDPAVLRRPLGHRERRRHRRPAGDQAALRLGARAGRAGAAQRRRRSATTSPCSRSSGKAPRTANRTRGISDRQRSATAVFASTIQASVLGTDAPDDLDDAEIERSIDEINEAIKRSSQHKKSDVRCRGTSADASRVTAASPAPLPDGAAPGAHFAATIGDDFQRSAAAPPSRCARSASRAATPAMPKARCWSSSATPGCCAPRRSRRRCRRTSAAAARAGSRPSTACCRAPPTRAATARPRAASRAAARRRSSA